MENTIQIIKSGNSWVAGYLGPHAEEIKELFGDWCIPTAFTSAADGNAVVEEIRKLNPSVNVMLCA